jgi:DNA-binding transcriptional MerR regulator
MMDKSPDAFRTISEVAEDLDVPQHVLRFWETRFSHIKPLKRGGGRRYYRPDDIDLLRGIRHLLYGEGYTIKGVQRILKEEGPRFVQSIGRGDERAPARPQSAVDESDAENGEAAGDEAEAAPAHAHEPSPRGNGSPGRLASPAQETGKRTRDRDDGVAGALGESDIERLKAALAELTECERVLHALAAADEAAASDEALG